MLRHRFSAKPNFFPPQYLGRKEGGPGLLVSSIPLPSVARLGIANSLRFQLLVILLLGVVLPALFLVGVHLPAVLSSGPVLTSLVTAVAAAVIQVFTLRRMEMYPGVNISSLILPALAIIYGSALVISAIAQTDHSNSVLLVSFFATLAACYFLAALNGRAGQRQFLVVPGGRAWRVRELPELRSRFLSFPDLPEQRDVAVIADLHYDHRPEW